MPKHAGCYLCGSETQEILTSIPLLYRMHSIAVCAECRALPSEEIKRQVDAIEAAQIAARKAARAGADTGARFRGDIRPADDFNLVGTCTALRPAN